MCYESLNQAAQVCTIFNLENVVSFLIKNLVNVAMRMEEAFYNISLHLYNKNILEYAQIARNGTESKIPYIESHSSTHV